ncbi:calcium uniporter protein 4, mitochondrial [Neltuma alba]|uniref:calcium uniporter protein 4, mitochondrial n=1 Tax=Neltuma alba TaxID=207710 RepID=UPI0010A3B9A2|nr:calcium uniporter protein 4, mitochondrial [Prosopis alba]
MALQKSFTKRLLDGFKTFTAISSPPPPQYSPTVPPNASKTNIQSHCATPSGSPLDSGFFRRFLHRRVVCHPGQTSTPDFLSLPMGDDLREKLKSISVTGDFRGLIRPPRNAETPYGISVKEAKKILGASQLEKVKARLREIPKTSISYSEYVGICVQGCENEDQGAEFAKKLDESGSVIVLGNVVFLRPEQVVKAMERLICETIAHPDDRRRKELEEMEKQKEKIDEEAKAMVWRELYVGLGLMMAQTIGLMRLTFWELSWDVMEPICFFLTSLHVALAYLFFLRTSTEPTFQGYFRRRFTVKQHKLMRSHNFDVHKYNQLCKACYPISQ